MNKQQFLEIHLSVVCRIFEIVNLITFKKFEERLLQEFDLILEHELGIELKRV